MGQETLLDFIRKRLEIKQKESEPSISDIIRGMWDGKPSYLSLSELVHLQYNGHEIDISDLAGKLKNGKELGLPLTKIIKKRAAYQQYLENRERKKEEARKAKEEGPQLPEVHLPDIELPVLPD